MPDFSKLVDKHFKVANFPQQDGTPLRFTVKGSVAEEIGQAKEILPVLYFEEDTRGLVLSSSKYNELAGAFGSRDTDKWIGRKVDVFIDWKIAFRGTKGGMRVIAVRE